MMPASFASVRRWVHARVAPAVCVQPGFDKVVLCKTELVSETYAQTAKHCLLHRHTNNLAVIMG